MKIKSLVILIMVLVGDVVIILSIKGNLIGSILMGVWIGFITTISILSL